MVWGLVLSPAVGTAWVVVLRRRPIKVLRAAVLASSMFSAVLSTAVAATTALSPPREPIVAEWSFWTLSRSIPHSPDPLPNRELPWLRLVVSFGWDRLNAAALLGIPWLAVSALLAFEAPAQRAGSFYGLFCVWETCLLGTYAAYDAPSFLAFDAGALWFGGALTCGWGQTHRRDAASKFWRYQFAGQCAFFVGLTGLGVVAAWCHYYLAPNLPSISWTWHTLTVQLPRVVRSSWEIAAYFESAAGVLLAVLACGALLRSPVVPLHSWWPVFTVEAPAPVAVLTASAWCPIGLYAWGRFVAPVFPNSWALHAGPLATWGEWTIVLAGLWALAHTDLRRLAAYAALGLQGIAWICASLHTGAGTAAAVAMSQAAGLTASAWLLVIALWEQRYHTPQVGVWGGLATRPPRFSVALATVLIGLSGFPAVFRAGLDLTVVSLLAENRPYGLVAAVAGGLAIGWGGLRAGQRLLFCPLSGPTSSNAASNTCAVSQTRLEDARDLTWSECAAFVPLLAWCLWIGMAGLSVEHAGDTHVTALPRDRVTSQGPGAP